MRTTTGLNGNKKKGAVYNLDYPQVGLSIT